MSLYSKLKLFGGAVVLVFLIIGDFRERIFGMGELHFLAIGTAGVEVSVDGAPQVRKSSSGDHYVFEVPQGQHRVVVTDKSTGRPVAYTVDVKNGHTQLLLPVRAEQCFVHMDMTDAAYSEKPSSSAKRAAPRVREHFLNANAPFKVSRHIYFTMDEMPAKRDKHEKVELIRDLPCSLMDKGSEVLWFATRHHVSDSLYSIAASGGDLRLALPAD